MSELPIKRRAERSLVRFQARLESGSGDRVIPYSAAALLGVVLAWLGLARLEGLAAGAELAGYSQSLWLLSEGFVPRASIFGSDVHVLELRWSFVLYPLSVLAIFFSPAQVLTVAQSVALAIAVIPLWRLARQVANLRVAGAMVVVTAFALHPVTHSVGVGDFNPGVLAVPALIGMVYFASLKRWRFYWLCVAFALLCRADLGLAVALWGLVVVSDGERRTGMVTVAVGFCWSFALLLVVQPILSQSGGTGSRIGYGGAFFGDALISSAKSPVAAFGELFTQPNVALVVTVLAPVLFLSLLSMRHLLPAVPLTGLVLYATEPTDSLLSERSFVLLTFVIVALAFSLKHLGTRGVDRVFIDVRLIAAMFAGAILFFVSTSPISPFSKPWNFSEQNLTDQSVRAVVGSLDEELPVKATPSALTLLSERPWVEPLEGDTAPSALNMGYPDFTRAVLIVERDIPERSVEDKAAFDRGMQAQGYVLSVNDEQNGVSLYVRG